MRHLFLLACLMLSFTAMAKLPTYRYELDWQNPAEHNYLVRLSTAPASGAYTDFKLPAWRPGYYQLQNFSAAVQRFAATDAQGNALSWHKVDKDTWRVTNPKGGDISLSYSVYSNTIQGRVNAASILMPGMAYFNPFTLFMFAMDGNEARYKSPCRLTIKALPQDWKVATQLARESHQVFTANSYHEFIDAPTMCSPTLRSFSFKQGRTTYYAHFQGKYSVPAGDEKQFLDGVAKIVQEQIAIWGEMPCDEYHMIYLLWPFPSGATEHTHSFMCAAPESVGASGQALTNLWGVTSHEIFHLWNVKRLRPAAMWPYQYEREAYTQLHWLTEGFTSYYDDLTIARAGLLSREDYLAGLAAVIGSLENANGQSLVSVSMSSFNSWLGASAYNDPSAGNDFYTQGARLAFLLDMKLRSASGGKVTLDDVMRAMYTTYFKAGKGLPEDGVQTTAEKLTSQSLADFFKVYAHGTSPFDYAAILGPMGLELQAQPAKGTGLKALGIDRAQAGQQGLVVLLVRPGSDASATGLHDQFTITRINGKPLDQVNVVELVDGLTAGSTVVLEGTLYGEPKTYTITYSGRNQPRSFKLVPKDGADAKWMDSWLGSKAK